MLLVHGALFGWHGSAAGKAKKHATKFNGVTITLYSTPKETDPAFSGAVSTTATNQITRTQKYYYVTSPVAAKSDFLASIAVEGYGFTAGGTLLNNPHNTTLKGGPPGGVYPPGTDITWTFYSTALVIDSSGIAKGDAGNPLVSTSAAIFPGSFPSGMTFSILGHPELGQRTVDDTMANMGSRGIDIYNKDATMSQVASGTLLNQTIVIPSK
jgi:3D (Asp-Asp-Asp) domain-containing protein